MCICQLQLTYTVPVKSLDTPTHSRGFLYFYNVLHCRIMVKTYIEYILICLTLVWLLHDSICVISQFGCLHYYSTMQKIVKYKEKPLNEQVCPNFRLVLYTSTEVDIYTFRYCNALWYLGLLICGGNFKIIGVLFSTKAHQTTTFTFLGSLLSFTFHSSFLILLYSVFFLSSSRMFCNEFQQSRTRVHPHQRYAYQTSILVLYLHGVKDTENTVW